MPGPTDDETAIRAAEGGAEKSGYVREIFSEIAPRYDLLNHLLSLNIDRVWRRKAIAELNIGRRPAGHYLDLCAGTLDISVALAATKGFAGSVIGADFAEPMLRAGRRKIGAAKIAPVTADALLLPLPDACMAGAIVAFGIRNVADPDACLREVHRVLEPGAKFVILEFSTPRSPLINAAYQLYFNTLLPAIGGLISGHRTAYRYLPRSVANFPVQEELARRMTDAGFRNVWWRSLTLGIAAIHSGERN
ncbi:MAG: bifunctional demethylmenaquinone methyltransferase/2-methoxy-6-polyprenyl-1,4-benzoquinol methylase UbiE [Gemmatimonadaceae bacterium]|nr:bifunctional demethylmenaquinone methyltransferase/2-methoxy-6-polyprenyl-1,4-benzoquinol methylase UbiE [Gemmatimonadaceae bacterium]